MENAILTVDGLSVEFLTPSGRLKAVEGVSLTIRSGESLGLVGESGSGKSVTALSIMGLLPASGCVTEGEVRFQGRDLLRLKDKERRRIRGRDLAVVFQEPLKSLNPVLRCGEQVFEVLWAHSGLSRSRARERVHSLFGEVGLADPQACYDAYPHQLSGGMRQRIMIAMALACTPRLLLADEPTTALDVTIQAQIMALLTRLKRMMDLAMLFISHNLALVSEVCDRVAVLYAGRIVETGPAGAIYGSPRHPYTRALLDCLPRMDGEASPPEPIPGEMPHPLALPRGCRFRDRCVQAFSKCAEEPCLEEVGREHSARCWLGHE